MAEFHQGDVNALFSVRVSPDAKNSALYAFYAGQGGLGLPDRDYYLSDGFAKQREAYRKHVTRMFGLLGETDSQAAGHATNILSIETALASASRARAVAIGTRNSLARSMISANDPSTSHAAAASGSLPPVAPLQPSARSPRTITGNFTRPVSSLTSYAPLRAIAWAA